MNKILLNLGLLAFCFALIFFSQRSMPLIEVVIKSFIVFISLTLVLGILLLFIIKIVHKNESLITTETTKTRIK